MRRRPRLPSLIGPLILVIVAIVGNIVVIRAAGGTLAEAKNLASLSQIFTAATWVGAVWLGALLAHIGILRSRR